MTTPNRRELRGLVVIDTNVILRWVLDDIPEQSLAAERLWNAGASGAFNIFVPLLVMFEVIFTLERSYHHTPERVAATLREIASIPHVTIESWATIDVALRRHTTTALGFADCFIIAITEQHQPATLLTFDQQMRRQSPTDTADPQEILDDADSSEDH